MPNERLADLTAGDIAEAALADESIRLKVASQDPRVQLMERLYGDAEAKRDIQRHSKRLFPKASVLEIDVPEEAKKAIAEDVKAIQDLRKELETDKQHRAHTAFRAQLVEAGAEAKDLDAIEAFMVDNELGPKSLGIAVEKYYESKELAEPTGSDLVWELPDESGAHMKALLSAPPGADLDQINAPFVERIFEDTFGKRKGRRSGRVTA